MGFANAFIFLNSSHARKTPTTTADCSHITPVSQQEVCVVPKANTSPPPVLLVLLPLPSLQPSNHSLP